MLYSNIPEEKTDITPTTNILDVLPDGTITRASFSVKSIISLTVARENMDVPFTITSCDVWSRDEGDVAEAVTVIQDTMRELDIDIMIPVVNANLAIK